MMVVASIAAGLASFVVIGAALVYAVLDAVRYEASWMFEEEDER